MLYLYSTLELVAVATTNSHYVFCFCNLIIAVLLIGSTASSTIISYQEDVSEEEPIKDQSSVVEEAELEEVIMADQKEEKVQEQEEKDVEREGVTTDQEEEKVQEHEEDDADEYANNEEVQEEEEEEDELRRRIERFIEKINEEWKAEKLRTRQQDRIKISYNTLINVK